MNEIKEMKKWIILIVIAAICYLLVNHLGAAASIISKLFSVLLPFILGGALAFILNIPVVKIENLLVKNVKNKDEVPTRTISIILSLLLLVVVIMIVAFLIIPELIENIQVLINNIPAFIGKVEVFVLDLLDKYPDIQIKIAEMFKESANTANMLSNILNYIVSGAIGFISSLVSGVITLFTAIIFAVYILSQKEYLVRGCKSMVYAYLKKEKAEKVIEIGKLANKTFSKFISGQCVEAVILGCIFFVILTIFRFPYALLISVLTTVTALVPIFGAVIAMVIGAILIAIHNPLQSLFFIIVFQVIQQIEGNFIYPKVVGKSVGLSPMWTLLAISVGGSLYGIIGMFLALPVASILYALIRNDVFKRLKIKKISEI